MRYLRMLTNAVAGGVLTATYLVVLVLQLNPHVPLGSITVVRWFRTLIELYGLYLTVAIYLLILVREALASRPLHPAWLSVRLVAWVSAAGAAWAAAVTWANLVGFGAVLGPAAADRMRQGAVATTVLATVLVALAVLRYSFGRKGGPVVAGLLVVTLISSVIVPLGLRGPGELPVPAVRRNVPALETGRVGGRVRLILLDGASLDFIRERVAVGGLPNFGRLVDHGATIDLATIRPTESIPVWAAAMTGKLPPKNGVRSSVIYRVAADDDDPVTLLPDYCFARSLVLQDFVQEDEYLTSASLHARTFWDIAADDGVVSGVVNMPLTWPSHAERGFVVSDYFGEKGAVSPLRLNDQQAADPTTAVETARDVFDAWQDRPWTDAIPGSSAGEPAPAEYRQALWDHAYSETARELELAFAPRLTVVRYTGLNAFGLSYLEAAEPDEFGHLPDAGRGPSVLDRYYAYIDAEVGAALSGLGPDDLLVVMSGFGMERVSVPRRLLARLLDRPNPSGGHENAPDGFLLAYGSNVAHGSFARGSVVDLTPTVLYYLGLPVGADMDGFTRTDLFRASYTIDHPVTFIGTHER